MEDDQDRVIQAKTRLMRKIRAFVKDRGEPLPDFIAIEGRTYRFEPAPLLELGSGEVR